jgi:hypothetical protein
LNIQISIIPDAKWIGRAPLGHVNSLDGPLSLGLQRNKIPLSYPRPKRSMSPPLLWMRQTLKDYGYTIKHIPLLCDDASAIKIAYNPCEHSRTKHIDIRHHFLRDHAIKGDIIISHVGTNDQLADIFTKPLVEKQFRELRSELSIIDSQNVA